MNIWLLHGLILFWALLFSILYPTPASPQTLANNQPLKASISNNDLNGLSVPLFISCVQDNTGQSFGLFVDHAGVIIRCHSSSGMTKRDNIYYFPKPSTQFLKGDKILTVNGVPFSVATWKRVFSQIDDQHISLTLLRGNQTIETSCLAVYGLFENSP